MTDLRNRFILVFVGSLFLVCCAPVIIKPTANDVDFAKKKWTDVTSEQLDKGYDLYIAKCGSCHFLYKPTKFPESKWLEMFPPMQKKAKLNDEQIDLIMKYIITKRNSTDSAVKK